MQHAGENEADNTVNVYEFLHNKRTKRILWFPDPQRGEKGERKKETVTQIHGCIPAISVDES